MMEMDISKGNIVGLFILFGHFLSANAQCNVLNCNICGEDNGVQICLACNDDFGQNVDRTVCCSKGCPDGALSYPSCNTTNGRCTYEGCKDGYIGEYCQRCSERIQNCNGCGMLDDSGVIKCTNCAIGFFITTDQRHCCPQGCDSCTGTDGTICTSCKATYYLYNEGCDRCGNNCVALSDGSARCDPVDGRCYLGCQDGWHGPKCDVECTLSRCERCAYNTFTQNLTCADCSLGYYGQYCGACGIHCLPATASNLELCYQDGTCANGCEPGYRGIKCDMACDSAVYLGNCDECERYAFRCTKCKPNYWGDQCQNECNQNCVVFGGARTCSIDQGSCDFGCLIGYYKHDCSGSCPFCGNDVCDRTSGDCLDPTCDPGYHGSNCNFTCPTNCVPDPVSGNPLCNFQYGNCTNGCIDGKWGAFCNQGCSVHCALSPAAMETEPLCEQKTGKCVYQCKPGYFEHDCRKACESRCVDESCDIDAGTCLACNETNLGYLCPIGSCVDGWYGPQCNLPCKTECRTCDIQTGECTSCVNNYYSFPACDKTCSINCNIKGSDRTCNQVNGNCIYGCKTGYYSLNCSDSCGNCDRCDANDGSCPTCNAGWWGTTCKNQCSSYCARGGSRNVRMCRQSDGYCEFGCEAGYYGDTCSSNCLSLNCANGVCDRQTGSCTAGCLSFFYDTSCDRRCDACRNGQCEQANGYCIDDCPANSYGNQCEKECLKPLCTDATCDRYSGYCSDCQMSPTGSRCSVKAIPGIISDYDNTTDSLKVGAFIGVGVGSVAATLLAVGILIIIKRHLRNGHLPEQTHELSDARQGNNIANDALPNRPSTIDSAYENAPVPVYEELRNSIADSNTYDHIDGFNFS